MKVPPVTFFRAVFIVYIARSASPFEHGWYGAVLMWTMLLLNKNFPNLALLNPGPLSLIMLFGMPKQENRHCNTIMFAPEEILETSETSNHFAFASTFIRSTCPSTGSA